MTGQPLSSREEWSGDAATGDDTFEERCRNYLLSMPAWRDINGAQISAEIDRLRAEAARLEAALAEIIRVEGYENTAWIAEQALRGGQEQPLSEEGS